MGSPLVLLAMQSHSCQKKCSGKSKTGGRAGGMRETKCGNAMKCKVHLDHVMREFSEGSGKMTTLEAALANSIKRSDELVTENEVKGEKIRNRSDALDKAERQEAKDILDKVMKNCSTEKKVYAWERLILG